MSDQASNVQVGMTVYGSDGRRIGSVERIDGEALVAAGCHVTLAAIERIEDGDIHLWGDCDTYTVEDGEDEAVVQCERSRGLPHTDAPLFVNEREVEQSLEERLPRDGAR